MATKPATTPEIWASNGIYMTGPFIGSSSVVAPAPAVAAEGDRPGALFPTAAEHKNFQSFWETTWITSWLSLGSSTGAADAHIVETGADGRTRVEGADVIASNPNPYALFVRAPPGAGNAIQATGASAFGDATILGITTGLGAAVEAQSATAGPGFYADHSGTGEGVLVVHTGAGTAGLFSNSSTGLALDVVGSDAIQASNFQGGVGQAGVVAVSGVNATTAIGALGDGTAMGVDAVGGSGGAAATGARGTAAHADAAGVVGRSAAAASTSGRGVYAEGRGSGAALEAVASANYAAILQGDTTSPVFPAMLMVGTNARPSDVTAGGVSYNSTEDQIVTASALDTNYRGIWTTTGGKATAYTASANAAQNMAATIGSAAWVTAATCSSALGNAPKVAGREAILRFRCEARNAGVFANNVLNVRLYDVTAGAVMSGSARFGFGNGDTAGFTLADSGTDWQRSIVYDFRFTMPAAGQRTWRVEIRAEYSTGIVLRDCSLTLEGLF